jgi:DNA-binding CsgD family transcriptional regulator
MERCIGPVRALTNAERNVLIVILEGKSTRDIAVTLSRSVHTNTNHTSRVLTVFDVPSRASVACAEKCTPRVKRASPVGNRV